MRKTHLIALAIAVMVALWLLSGQLGQGESGPPPTVAERRAQLEAEQSDRPLTEVRVRTIRAEPKPVTVTLRGRTRNERTVDVRAETSGLVVARPAERGLRVEQGDILCRLAIDDREARLGEAQAAVEQTRLEYEGAQRLADRGLQSETAIATARAQLAAARARLKRAELDLEHTEIAAPFAGVVDEVQVEIGDFMQPASTCATLVDLDPMLLVGRVAEREVGRIEVGMPARGTLINGKTASGRVTFVGKRSDQATRTYPIEVEVANPDFSLRSGITTEIAIPVDVALAHRISPSLLALDDAGDIGVRTVDVDQRVEFHQVEILADDGGAIWVRGLPEVATLITVGQELVVPGEKVASVRELSEHAADASASGKSPAVITETAGPSP